MTPGRTQFPKGIGISPIRLITLAYDVNPAQLVGLPEWGRSAFFSIEGKLPANAGEKDVPRMVQALLVDRFHLIAHRESQTRKVRTITIAKEGFKLRPAVANCTTDAAEDQKLLLQRRRCGEVVESAPPVNYRYGVVYQGFSVSMADLAAYFSRWNPSYVYVDETGLKGLYDFEVDLNYTPPPDIAEGSDDMDAFNKQVFRKGWENQAGLLLDTQKDRVVPVLVIDHIERPTPNGPAPARPFQQPQRPLSR